MHKFEALCADFLKDYPEAVKETDTHFPIAFSSMLDMMIIVDSNHAHDLVTHHSSLTGLLKQPFLLIFQMPRSSSARAYGTC